MLVNINTASQGYPERISTENAVQNLFSPFLNIHGSTVQKAYILQGVTINMGIKRRLESLL